MEVQAEAKVVLVAMKCDHCANGYMEHDEVVNALMTYPPKYSHRCSNCGHVETYTHLYPYHKVVQTEEYKMSEL